MSDFTAKMHQIRFQPQNHTPALGPAALGSSIFGHSALDTSSPRR